MNFPSHPSKRRGFTLIELLLVIAIITVLAGLLFPAINKGILTAKRNKAAAEAKSIAGAIEMFYRDYGYLPTTLVQGFDEDFNKELKYQDMSDTQSRKVIQILMGDRTITNTNGVTLNPKGKFYLDSDTSIEDGEYLDPWGNQYRIKLDLDYNGKIEYFSGSAQYNATAIVVSGGKDGNPDTLDDNVANVLLLTD